jgi:glutathione S-transferase
MMQNLPPLTLCDFPAITGHEGWISFSPYVLEVGRALKLAQLPFEHKHVNVLEIRAINPAGQLPVLVVGTENVPDSTRILHRIEALSPGALTGGLDAAKTAEAWLWEEFADTALYPYVLAARWVDDRGWSLVRDAFFRWLPAPVRAVVAPLVRRKMARRLVERDFLRSGLDSLYERMGCVLDRLEQRAPTDGFWLGPRASVADLGLFAHLHSLRLPGLWLGEVLQKRERLTRYLDRVDVVTR